MNYHSNTSNSFNHGTLTSHDKRDLKLLTKHKLGVAATLAVYNKLLETAKEYFGLVDITEHVYIGMVKSILSEDFYIDITNALSTNSRNRASAQSNIATYSKFNPQEIIQLSYEIVTSEGVLPYFLGYRRSIIELIVLELTTKRWGFGGIEATPKIVLVEGIATPKIMSIHKILLRVRD
jgi:hypothetical protein